MKMCTVYLKDELLDEIKYYMHEGEKVSPFICRVMQEYVEYKKRENSTGITQDLLTLTSTVQRITEYINKGNIKPVTNTVQRITEYINKGNTKPVTNTNTKPEHVTTKVEEKKVEKREDTFNDEDFDFELSEEDLK